MTVAADRPPLTPAETREVLRRLGDLTERIVLVGGQALAFWVERYADRLIPPGPVNSQDIDFCGHPEVVSICATRLGGTFKVPEPFDPSPNTGLVQFIDPGGHQRRIDFLASPFGLGFEEVLAMAIGVDVPDDHGMTSFLVMHPVHCLESRVCNVAGLPGYKTALGLAQLRVSVLCAREYLRDRLGEPDAKAVRAVLDLNERIFRFTFFNLHAATVWRDHGVDTLDAILVEDRLPERFQNQRLPHMRELLARKRSRWKPSTA